MRCTLCFLYLVKREYYNRYSVKDFDEDGCIYGNSRGVVKKTELKNMKPIGRINSH